MTHLDTINFIEDKWNNAGITIHPSSNTYSLMLALSSQYDRTLDEVEDIRDSHHVSTATGRDLEKIGKLAEVERQTGESDDKYRLRIIGNVVSAFTGTTFSDVIQFISLILETDMTNIRLFDNLSIDPATLVINADASIYSNSPLTNSDIISLAEDSVPAGHEVILEERGTFEIKSDGAADDPAKGLTSDSISTGGTLAADIA